jgi:hypothetical protein
MFISLVAASEKEEAQTGHRAICGWGCKNLTSGVLFSVFFRTQRVGCPREKIRRSLVSQNPLERGTKEGNSPVGENRFVLLVIYLEYLGT